MSEETGIVRIQPAAVARPMRLEFTPDQERMIRNMFLSGAPPEEAAVLMEVARSRGLNPITRQIHFVKRWDRERGEVWSAQISIDGLRALAERTGTYDGQDEPEFEEEPDGSLRLCKVKVYRKGINRPFVGVAYWDEYKQTFKDKKGDGQWKVTPMWQKMPHVMLAKCAEALAFRKAFPEDTSGLYVPEEMAQAENPGPERLPSGETFERRVLQATGAPVPTADEVLHDQIEKSLQAVEAKQKAKALVKEAAQVLEGEIVEPEKDGPPPDEFLMPFADQYDGHWEAGAPIASLEVGDLKRLAKWKSTKHPEVPKAAAAELAKRKA